MLSTAYRLRLEEICNRIARQEPVGLEDMIWVEKLSKSNQSAASILRKARRKAANPEMTENSLDGFLNALDLGDPDIQNHRTGFNSVDEIVDFFSEGDDKPTDWRQRD
jgi:hypothetical protein